MKIVQLLVTLQKGDAIGNFALALHKMLLDSGYDAEIYAYNLGNNIKEISINNIEHFKNLKSDDLIVYQMCEGHKINALIRKQNCRKMMIYHNFTPAEFFQCFGTELYSIQNLAQQVISSMKDVFDKCIAVSEFNRQNLITMGYASDKINVIPLYIEWDDYKKEPDSNTLQYYNDECVNILFVGRIVPNKKQEDIIRIFAYYHKFVNRRSRLFVIGSPFVQNYNTALREYIDYMGISDSVIMPGHSTFSEILAYYKCADIFLCMSEHEGFGVPLVEAMLFDVPIIAYDSSAISDTLGDSGVLVDNKEPKKIAEIISKVIEDDSFTDEIILRQRKRLTDFEYNKLKTRYLNEIKSMIGERQ